MIRCGVGAGGAPVDEAAAPLGGRVWWPSTRFSHSGDVEQQTVPVPVLGDVADAGLAALAGSTATARSRPPSTIVPVAPRRMPMIASTSSAWPLPSTPAMPSTSPRWIVEA